MIKLRLDSGKIIYLSAAHVVAVVVAVTEGPDEVHCMVHTDDRDDGYWYIAASAEHVSQLVDAEAVRA